MKELYISDLDGTLLGSDAKLSTYTINTLNRLFKDGLNFTIATARARETTLELLEDVNLTLPIILMNGVLIYDMNTKGFMHTEHLPVETSKQISEVFKLHNTTGFMYKLEGKDTVTYYESLNLPVLKDFFDDRTTNSSRKFEKANDFYTDADESVIYFVLIDRKDPLLKIREDIEKIPGVTTTMYRDIYTEDLYFFEVFSEKASKANASLFLKQYLGAERIIAFGDNYNDVSLFEVSDECYATSNAKQALKDISTAEIASCTEDGVPRYLQSRFNTQNLST